MDNFDNFSTNRKSNLGNCQKCRRVGVPMHSAHVCSRCHSADKPGRSGHTKDQNLLIKCYKDLHKLLSKIGVGRGVRRAIMILLSPFFESIQTFVDQEIEEQRDQRADSFPGAAVQNESLTPNDLGAETEIETPDDRTLNTDPTSVYYNTYNTPSAHGLHEPGAATTTETPSESEAASQNETAKQSGS